MKSILRKIDLGVKSPEVKLMIREYKAFLPNYGSHIGVSKK